MNPEDFRYKPLGLDSYPLEHPTLKLDYMLKMVYPEGLSIYSSPKKPSFRSCYIAMEEEKLEQFTLNFMTFSEPLPQHLLEIVSFFNSSTIIATLEAIQSYTVTK